jgi:hypothetical protein
MKLNFILLLLLFSTCNIVYAQSYGVSYQNQISGKKILNKETGKIMNDRELSDLIKENPHIYMEPVVNKFGEIESFTVDPGASNTLSKRDTTKRTPKGGQFPPFIMKSIQNKVLDSEELKGKWILFHFQLEFIKPFFAESALKEFNNLVSDLKGSTEMVAIVLTQSSKEDILSQVDPKNLSVDIVPDGRNFFQRYLVVVCPSYALIDKNGNLVRYFKHSESSEIKAVIERTKQ